MNPPGWSNVTVAGLVSFVSSRSAPLFPGAFVCIDSAASHRALRALGSVRAGAMGRFDGRRSLRFFRALGWVRTGAMGSVRTGTMGSVRSRRFSFTGFILRRALAQFCAAVVAPISDTLRLHFLTRLGSVRRRGNDTLDRASDTTTTRPPARAFVPGPPLNAGAQPVTKRTRTAGQVLRPASHRLFGFIDSGIAEVLCVSRGR